MTGDLRTPQLWTVVRDNSSKGLRQAAQSTSFFLPFFQNDSITYVCGHPTPPATPALLPPPPTLPPVGDLLGGGPPLKYGYRECSNPPSPNGYIESKSGPQALMTPVGTWSRSSSAASFGRRDSDFIKSSAYWSSLASLRKRRRRCHM